MTEGWAGTEPGSDCCGASRRSVGWSAGCWWWGWPGGWNRGGCSRPSLLVFGLIDLAIWNGPLLTTAGWLYLGLFMAAGIPGIGFLTGLTSLVNGGLKPTWAGCSPPSSAASTG